MNEALKLIFILSLMGAGAAMFLRHQTVYRAFATIALISGLGGIVSTHGLAGLAIAMIGVGVVMPVVLMVASRLIFAAVWWGVRRQFPDEPVAPPVEPLSFVGAHRVMWFS